MGSEQQRSGSAGLQGGERRKLPVRGARVCGCLSPDLRRA